MLPDEVARFVRATAPEHDGIQSEMAARSEAEEFPIIGPESGGMLRLLARLTDAERVFEFGSGFGYSAYWFLRGGADRVVLTEFDADELDMAREYLDRAGFADRAVFEDGDAVETVEDYPGPFDVVLIDHQKHRYTAAFRKVRRKLPVGSVVVADNIMRGPIEFDALLEHFEDGTELPDVDEKTRGIAEYVNTVRADEDFETSVLPLGSGLAVSVRVNSR